MVMVQTIFIGSKYKGKITANKALIKFLEKNKFSKIILFASVQFLDLNSFISELKNNGIYVSKVTTKKRRKEFQILGCDIYLDNFLSKKEFFNSDAILYVGDGNFHPKAITFLLLSLERIKPVLTFNPISNQFFVLNPKEIEKEIKFFERNIRIFINSKTVGIIGSTKFGQQHINSMIKLKNYLESCNKKVYLFIGNEIKEDEFCNFNFIDCWVNSACPRISTDNSSKIAIINMKEALNPADYLEKLRNFLKKIN
ncbi:MAG: diphthamide synthesis protein [Candidatus Pacearchaeota archaeon]